MSLAYVICHECGKLEDVGVEALEAQSLALRHAIRNEGRHETVVIPVGEYHDCVDGSCCNHFEPTHTES
jgi:hypothetical protein